MTHNETIKYKKIENALINAGKLISFIEKLDHKRLRLISINANMMQGVVSLKYYIEKHNNKLLILNVHLKKKQISSLYTFFKNADFIEREIAEIFGVKFIGNPNLNK